MRDVKIKYSSGSLALKSIEVNFLVFVGSSCEDIRHTCKATVK